MFRLIFCFVSMKLIACDEVIPESVSGGEVQHAGINLQTMSDKVLSALHFIPNEVTQASGMREIIMLDETSTQFTADFGGPDFDRGLETRGCGIYDALLHRKKQQVSAWPTDSPPPRYVQQRPNGQGFGQTGEEPPWRSRSYADDLGRSAPAARKERKKTRAPGGFLFEDEKAAFHFCCCCCMAGLCNKIPYHPKEGGYDY